MWMDLLEGNFSSYSLSPIFTFSYRSLNFLCTEISRYILEVFNNHFVLPDLGPIGANGLANARYVYVYVYVWIILIAPMGAL